jgi:2-phospho-L-lactate guanylyltransferase
MKPLAGAKERLAPVLSPDERRALSLAMLEDVVRAASVLDVVWVLNSDDDAADVAARAGGESRPDPTPAEGLNASLTAATAHAIEAGATGVLILSADCPASSQDDVRALSVGPGVLIAPDRTGRGTNALWRSPPGAIPLAYGSDSKRAHRSLAHVHRVSCAVMPRARVALDVDRPRDLDLAWDAPVGDATRAALASLGYPARRRG